MEKQAKVFISYSRKDKEIVKPLVEKINKALNTKCWVDLNDIPIGSFFDDDIQKAIENSEIVLFLLSDNSIQSEWTRKEIIFAQNEKKRIVPIDIDGKGPRGWFKFNFPHVDCIDISSIEQSNKLFNHLKQLSNDSNNQEQNEKKTIVEPEDNKMNPCSSFYSKNKKGCTITFCVSLLALLAIIPFSYFHASSPSHNIKTSSSINEKPIYSDNDQVAKTNSHPEKNRCNPINLGLTSGTLWADHNIGASSPSDFGDLFAWGETSIKKNYSQGYYNAKNKPSKTIARTKFDAASILLGKNWSLPTEQQYKELIDECQWTWKQIDGHVGFEIEGPNGNSIFLPATGWICSTHIEYQNTYGYYWTSDRVIHNPQFARSLRFPDKEGKPNLANGYLYYGRGIRAVYTY